MHAFDPAALLRLPEAMGSWELALRQAPVEVSPDGVTWLVIVTDSRSGFLRCLTAVAEPTEVEVLGAVARAMTNTDDGLTASRPRQLRVTGEELSAMISGPLEGCDVGTVVVAAQPTIEAVMDALRDRGPEASAGTLLGSRVKEGQLAAAAARIAEMEPWRYIEGELPLVITEAGSGRPPRLLVVMGQNREVEGIAAYESVAAYELGYELGVPTGAWCLLYLRAFELERAAREAFEQRGLAVTHGLYPRYSLLSQPGERADITVERDARRVLAELEALTRYFADCLEELADGDEPVRANIKLSNGRRVGIEPRADLVPGEDDDDFVDDYLLEPGDETAEERLPGAEVLSGALEDLDQLAELGEIGALGELAEATDPTFSPDGERLPPAGQDLPLVLEGLEYRVMFLQLPRGMVESAPGAKVGFYQAQRRATQLPDPIAAIVVKMLKSDAERVAPWLSEVTRIRFRRSPFGGHARETLILSEGNRDIGLLGSWTIYGDEEPPHQLMERVSAGTGAFILFVSGGADRSLKTLKPHAIVGGLHVDLGPVELAGTVPAIPLAEPDSESGRAGPAPDNDTA
ncbi:MAG: hypothetical protein JRI68_29080 [Deltaproteobacteria bacterium]|nr:hypothetical protein [Deltaproteobacteria bacterium]